METNKLPHGTVRIVPHLRYMYVVKCTVSDNDPLSIVNFSGPDHKGGIRFIALSVLLQTTSMQILIYKFHVN